MSDAGTVRLAVLGSPIAHSLSPALQGAAYRTLGLNWDYGIQEVAADGLPAFLAGLGPEWRGLSLTMPLKRTVLPLLDSIDPVAEVTRAANTVLLGRAGGRRTLSGFNTDVYGVARSLRDAGVERVRSARVLGGGATAGSMIAALSGLGAFRVLVSVRDVGRAADLVALGRRLGTEVVLHAFGDGADRTEEPPDVVASTLPASVDVAVDFSDDVARRAVLFDVVYAPWPTPLAARWSAAGGTVVPGIDMLIHQALLQVRIFVGGDPDVPLPGEPAVLSAMAASVDRELGRDWRGPVAVGGF
jgi:shikimate dehydrogenase